MKDHTHVFILCVSRWDKTPLSLYHNNITDVMVKVAAKRKCNVMYLNVSLTPCNCDYIDTWLNFMR